MCLTDQISNKFNVEEGFTRYCEVKVLCKTLFSILLKEFIV